MARKKSFLKSGLECIMPLLRAEVFVELPGDLHEESRIEKSYHINTFPEVISY